MSLCYQLLMLRGEGMIWRSKSDKVALGSPQHNTIALYELSIA
jgi:hypothetical protein